MELEEQDEPKIEPPPPPGFYSLNNSSCRPRMSTSPVHLESPPTPSIKPRYRECLKNHAVGLGGHAVDGCCEFMPAGADGTIDALKCAACNCHRNFHRKDPSTTPRGGGELINLPHHQYHHPPQQHFLPYYHRTPSGYLHMAAPSLQQRPLALPSISGGGGGGSMDQEDMSNPSNMGAMKKRNRTKFTAEQKDKMLGLAESLGWRIQKQDEAAVQQFCDEMGVRRHVLKVWMHNNKHTLGKKPYTQEQ